MRLSAAERTESPEAAYLAASDPGHRRRFAQFFTPFPVADLMARWVLAGGETRRLLDPALGLGVFARAVAGRSLRPTQVVGYELDPALAARAEAVLADLPGGVSAEVRRGDFLASPWEERYDGILCNPPWSRFQDYVSRAARIREVEVGTGVRLQGQSNLHSLFLLKALSQLAPGGRAAFVVPSEFLNAGYGSAVKARLLEGGALRHAVVFDSRARLFPGAVTTACVLLLEAPGGREGADADAVVAFHRAGPEEDLEALWRDRIATPGGGPGTRREPAEAIDPGAKWRGYWDDTFPEGYGGKMVLGDWARVARGIATGCNAFFVLGEPERLAAGLPENCLLPCVARARDAEGPVFRPEDLTALRSAGRPAWLLDAEGKDHPGIKAYLERGIRDGAHLRFLTSRRSPWYALEERPPAPLWVSVFSRGGDVRPVLNLAGARNLTAFHAVYPAGPAATAAGLSQENVSLLLFAWLLTPRARSLARAQAREYGSGLEKLEPKDLAAVPVPDFARLGKAAVGRILALVAALAEGRVTEDACAAGAGEAFRGAMT
ncbi:MAG TPA: N-6 DNA methylase [Fibrobacteria bacterium]|nr:N-6 DNA methylase [Fibrobacteria bacterium]